MNRPPRVLGATGALALVLVLSSCGAIVSPRETVLPTAPSASSPSSTVPSSTVPSDTVPSAAPSSTLGEAGPVPDGEQDCGGSPLSVSSSPQPVVLTGDCPVITIAGSGITVDAAAARVGAVEVNGDRNVLAAAGVGDITIGGQDNTVDAEAIDTLTLNGDRNAVAAGGAVHSVTVAGNDNRVTAAVLGTVSDAGQRNTIATH